MTALVWPLLLQRTDANALLLATGRGRTGEGDAQQHGDRERAGADQRPEAGAAAALLGEVAAAAARAALGRSGPRPHRHLLRARRGLGGGCRRTAPGASHHRPHVQTAGTGPLAPSARGAGERRGMQDGSAARTREKRCISGTHSGAAQGSARRGPGRTST